MIGFINSKIVDRNPSGKIGESEKKADIKRQAKEPPVMRAEFLGKKFQDHMGFISPAVWNLITAYVRDLFPSLLEWAKELRQESSGAELEGHLFQGLRKLLMEAGSALVSELLREVDTGFMGSKVTCPKCCNTLEFKGYCDAIFYTSLGPTRIYRAYYACTSDSCHYTVFPLDVKFGVTEHRALPWVKKQLSMLCEEMPYSPAVHVLKELTLNDLSICVRTAEEMCWDAADELKAITDEQVWRAFDDPLGPILPDPEGEIPKMLVCSADGTCVPTGEKEEYHEAKVGVVSEVLPYRKPLNTEERKEPILGNHSYTVSLGDADEFFKEFLIDCAIRGAYRVEKLGLMGDGSHWIWNRFKDSFKDLKDGIQVVEILDFWHALDHVADVSRLLFGQETEERADWYKARKNELYHEHLDAFFDSLTIELKRAKKNKDQELAEELQKEIDYFNYNRDRMKYKTIRELGFPMGSGTVEGACKNIVKDRTNRSGMRWSVKGCDAILRLRALFKSNRWEKFWDEHGKRTEEEYKNLKKSMLKRRKAA